MSAFNPYDHLSVYHDAEGNPVFENLEENGKPVSVKGADGKYHSVMIPKRYMSGNAYREWFKTEYPDGVIDVEDLTLNAVYDQTKGIFVEAPEYKVKVTLYEDRMMTKLIGTSYSVVKRGFKKYEDNIPDYANEGYKNSFELAQAIALKNAMVNAGFIFDTSAEALRAKDAQFVNICQIGNITDYVPLEASEATIKADLETGEIKEESEPKEAPKKATSNTKEKAAAEEQITNEFNSSETDVLSFINEMSGAKEEAKEAAKEEVAADDADEDLFSDEAKAKAGEVLFTCLDGASPNLKKHHGKRICDLEDRVITWCSARDLTGKLSEETIKALEIFAA